MDALEHYSGTVFVGCHSKEAARALHGLIMSLRRLGCLALVEPGERLKPHEHPGVTWVTFACGTKTARTLTRAVAELEGCSLERISKGILQLTCGTLADSVRLPARLEQISTGLRIGAEG